MTAPKPMVVACRCADGGKSCGALLVSCACGFSIDCGALTFWQTMNAAAHHSRSHTAERIADELASLMDQHRNTAHNSGGFESYHYGVATGYERSATLIREHLT